MLYNVHIEDCVDYEVEAQDEETAEMQAYEWWTEREPDIRTEII